MLRCLLVLTMLLTAAPALAEEAAKPAPAPEITVPKSYAECQKDARYTEKTGLKCVYTVPLEKSNSDQTRDYFACQQAKPNWEFTKTFKCEYADWDDKERPRFARCMRDRLPVVFPPFRDDCRLLYFNHDYKFPKNLKECLASDDHTEDATLELKQVCFVNITYAPETSGEVFNAEEAHKFVEKCQIAGGTAGVVDKKYPECSLGFKEE